MSSGNQFQIFVCRKLKLGKIILTINRNRTESGEHKEHEAEVQEVVVVPHVLRVTTDVIEQGPNEQSHRAVDPRRHYCEGWISPHRLEKKIEKGY